MILRTNFKEKEGSTLCTTPCQLVLKAISKMMSMIERTVPLAAAVGFSICFRYNLEPPSRGYLSHPPPIRHRHPPSEIPDPHKYTLLGPSCPCLGLLSPAKKPISSFALSLIKNHFALRIFSFQTGSSPLFLLQPANHHTIQPSFLPFPFPHSPPFWPALLLTLTHMSITVDDFVQF